VLLPSVVDASGFRVCHYSGNVFCSRCMPNGCNFVVPAKILSDWDFTPYPVCDEGRRVLIKNLSTPVVHIAALEPLVARESSAAVLEAARGVRRQLRILHNVMGNCAKARSSDTLSSIIYSRYAAINEVYSMKDLLELRGLVVAPSSDHKAKSSESDDAVITNVVTRSMTADEKKNSLLERLKQMRDAAVLHCARECESCKVASSKACGLCSDGKRLFVFDTQNVSVCGGCGSLYHKGCWDVAEGKCARCAALEARRGGGTAATR
jgi:hypothetical protein